MTGVEPARRRDFHRFHAPRVRIHWVRGLMTLGFLALAAHLLVPQIAGFQETWATLSTLTWGLVAAALIAQLLSYLGSGVLLQGLVRAGGGRLRVVGGSLVTLASGGVGLVAGGIAGSSALMYLWIHRGAVDPEGSGDGAGLAAGLKPVFNNALLLVIAIYGIVHLILASDLTSTELVGAVLILAILTALIGLLVAGATHPDTSRRVLTAIDHRWSRVRHRAPDRGRADRQVSEWQNAWLIMRSGGWKQPMLGAGINIAFDALSLYLLFAATGHRVGVGALLAGYSLALLIGKAAVIPGGVGIVEATMVGVFTSLGSERTDAVVAVLGYRVLSFWIPTLLGLPLAAWFQHRATSGVANARRAPDDGGRRRRQPLGSTDTIDMRHLRAPDGDRAT